MIITIEQLRSLASAGGSLILNASDFTFNQLAGICEAAEAGHSSLTLKQVSALTVEQLRALASAAPGLVTFDLTR
ncbi:MAG: hypothetical protein QM286_10740 [Acidobacteriota bacterium]|nr:hypothetical protein [Acidobacteriota bacterium]NLH68822.1 hypothetical protein [Brooklawnia sp.]